MKLSKALVGMALVLAVLPARAEILDLNVGDNSVRGAFAGPLSTFFAGVNGQYDIGVLIKPENQDDLLQPHIGFLVTGDAGARNADIAAGLGIRAVYVGRDADSGGAISLGGQLEGRLPSYNRIGLTGYAYYAPDVLTFGQVDEYREFGLALDYAVIRGGSIYVGYRNIHQKITTGNGQITQDLTADNGTHIGLRFKF